MAKSKIEVGGGRKIHVTISEEVHKRLRIKVAELDTTMQEWVAQLIADNVKPSNRKK